MKILNILLAAAPTAPAGTEASAPAWMQMMPMILIFVIAYFILIRPQMKKQK